MTSFRQMLGEKFTDLGKLSDRELKKGQKLHGDSDDFNEVDSRVFLKAITKIKSNDMAKGEKAKGMASLSIYKAREYSKMRCFLGKNNSSGYAIKDGDLVSVFSTQGSSAKSLMTHAISNGAKTLDCFAIRDSDGVIDGVLYNLYSKFGFKIDKSMNVGLKGKAYSIIKGVSDFVDDNDVVHPEDERVVIFMKLG